MEHFLQWAPVIAGAVPQRRHLQGCFVRLIQASGKCVHARQSREF